MRKQPVHPTIRRVASRDDWLAAELLLSDAARELRESAGTQRPTEQPSFASDLPSLRRRFGGPYGGLFVAWSMNTPHGIIGLSCHHDTSAELTRLFVSPTARRNGVGDRLVHHMVLRATGHGCNEIWLEGPTPATNPAVRLFTRNGFHQQAGRGRTSGLDSVVMARSLATLRPGPTTPQQQLSS